MKRILKWLPVLLVASVLSSCEKDDICDENTSTTPRLIVHFFDIANPANDKTVSDFSAKADGTNNALTFPAGAEIQLPLNPNEDSTTYTLILNTNNAAFRNEDRITINYSHSNVYVSRACGYKTVFLLDPVVPLVVTDAIPNDGIWIQDISVTQFNVLDENEVHISIYL